MGFMDKLKAKIALWFVKFGIMIYESEPAYVYSDSDIEILTKLWKYHDEFVAVISFIKTLAANNIGVGLNDFNHKG